MLIWFVEVSWRGAYVEQQFAVCHSLSVEELDRSISVNQSQGEPKIIFPPTLTAVIQIRLPLVTVIVLIE